MANYTWTGNTSNSLTAAGNYTPGTGPPGSGDTIRFPAKGGAAYAPSTNMDGLADTIARITTAEDCNYAVGGDGSPLKVQCTDWQHYGSAALYIDVDADTDTDILCDCKGGGSLNVAAAATCAAANFRILNGNVTFGGSCDITAFRVEVSGGVVIVNANASGIDELVQSGGIIRCGPAIAEAILNAGQLTLTDNGITAFLMQFGGLVEWDSSGTIALWHGHGGTLNSKKYGGAHTLSESYRWPGSKLIRIPELLTLSDDHALGGELL